MQGQILRSWLMRRNGCTYLTYLYLELRNTTQGLEEAAQSKQNQSAPQSTQQKAEHNQEAMRQPACVTNATTNRKKKTWPHDQTPPLSVVLRCNGSHDFEET